MNEQWIQAPKIDGNQELAAQFHMSPMAMRLIRSRAGESEAEVRAYLCGTLDDLADARLMKGMTEAVALLLEKIRAGASIRIIGDYDIDGVNATHILVTGLRRVGAQVDTVIPDRLKDGYGINEHLIEQAKEAGIDTIVTCDNGIAAAKEIAYAKELGMTVIVTDHHEIPYREAEDSTRTTILPPADVIVNPKQADCPYPYKKLCGAAVATIGDIMDLTGENRILVKYGLKQLADTTNPGYRALLAVNGLEGKKLTAYHIGFVIGPCINASGRLDTAKRALELLGASSKTEAEKLAGDLKALNDSRKDLTAKGTTEAIRLIEETDLGQDKVLVVYLPDCHESLAGIIAGRIRERYFRPCFVLTDGEEGVKGSGRSIPGYHMFEEMTKVAELFTKFGGHPMAAGLSIPTENVELLRKRLNENCRLTDADLIPKLSYDAVLPIQYAGEQIIKELELLEPFGKENDKPLFAAANVRVKSARVIGKNRNVLKTVLEDDKGSRLEGISFGDVEADLHYIESKDTVCLLYYPEINEFQGRRTVQAVIESWR